MTMTITITMTITPSSLFTTASLPISMKNMIFHSHHRHTVTNTINSCDRDRPISTIKIGAYYRQMLNSNPTDALLLANYAKFLHEVDKDPATAVEYCGRAILANPADPELFSLYANLIWETQRDHARANSYFHHALLASPHHSSILGSYAHFMWEAEDDQEGELGEGTNTIADLVAAS